MLFSSSNGLSRFPPGAFSVNLARYYAANLRSRTWIHHVFVGAIDEMDLDLASNKRPPSIDRGLGFSSYGHEKRYVTLEASRYKRPHELSVVLERVHDGFIVIFLQGRKSFATQDIKQVPDRLNIYLGGSNLAVCVEAILGTAMSDGIAIEQRKQCNSMTRGLEVSGDGVRDEAAERPTEQIVRPGRLNLANEI